MRDVVLTLALLHKMTRVIGNEDQAKQYVRDLTDAEGFARLEQFVALLLSENKRQNLISRPSEAQVWLRHVADSAQLLEHVPRETHSRQKPWLDLGTGAGLPGLVIAALRPELPIKLIESRARRIEFLQKCVKELSLDHCEVIGARLEAVKPFKAGVISARAFAPLTKLLNLSASFSTSETRYILPKGRSAAHELSDQKLAIRQLFHVEQSLTDPDAGIIVSN